MFEYNLTDNYLEEARLTGKFIVEKVSKDHILFEARFKMEPKLQISYSCKMK